MPKMESLGYLLRSDINRPQFINYLKFGLKVGGKYVVDPVTGLDMTGVVNWLRGNQVFEGNFYLEPAPRFGMLVVVPHIDFPWSKIPGFNGFLRKATVATNDEGILCGNGEPFLLDARKDIDELLSSTRQAFADVPVDNKDELNRALRGERVERNGEKIDLDIILKELGLFEIVNPA